MRVALAVALMVVGIAPGASAQDDVRTPYWASIASGEAMMRVGPGRTYPGKWLYKRKNLPVKVHKRYDNWRLIEDPDGERGWMIVSLMSPDRTGMILQGERRQIFEKPTRASRVAYLAEPGVVGRLSECDGQWCEISFGRKRGWIAQGDLYGVDAGERFD